MSIGRRDCSERLSEGAMGWGIQGQIPVGGNWKYRGERNGSLTHLVSLVLAVFAEGLWESSADRFFLVPKGGAEDLEQVRN